MNVETSRMTQPLAGGDSARFDLAEIANSFPAASDTLLLDVYLTNETAASSRVFRVYRPTPPHYHATCDEYLYVLSGRGTFWMEKETNGGTFRPGQLLFFRRGVVHAMPDLLEGPVVFLSVDTPRRDPRDIIFVNPADGTPESFIAGRDG
jgi:mannose-6-phosphate isomerase-like protein (cupin superfamily)